MHSLSFQFYPLLILETHNSSDAQDPLDYKQQGLCPPAPVPDHPQQPDESKSGMEEIQLWSLQSELTKALGWI